MKIKTFSIATLTVFIFSVSAFAQNADLVSMEKEILKMINEHRKSIGKSELVFNDFARKEAYVHSQNMASGKVPFSHKGFDERFNRLSGFLEITTGAENIANGPLNAKHIVSGWLVSPPHRKNIEDDFNLTGIGIAKAPNGTYFYTQIFLKSAEKPKVVPSEYETELLQLINNHRKGLGLPAIKNDEGIHAEALSYSQQMAAGKVPIGPPSFDNPIKSLLRRYKASKMVELIGYDYLKPKDLFDAWMSSTSQRDIIEGNFNLTGIGVFQSVNGKVFVTQVFLLQ
ncbi:MAG: CAP domain-containing protein [Bacteroidota bacterium]